MRDPDRPRGNPLFDDLDASDDAASRSAGGGSDATDPGSGETSGANDHTFRNTRRGGPDDPESPEAGVQTLVEALMAAGPETADHLLRAMEELLLAARTVMVAAEKGIVEQRAADRRSTGSDDAAPGDDVSGPTDGGSARSGFSSIDLD